MNRIKIVSAILLICLCLAAFSGCAKKEDDPTKLPDLSSRKDVVMDTHASVMPFEFSSQNGVANNLSGIDVEVGLQISKDLGKNLTLNNVSLQSVLVEVATQRADFGITSGLYSTASNKENLDFSNPFYISKGQVLVKASSVIKAYDTFKDAIVGVVKNYKEESVVNKYKVSNNLTVKEFDKASDAVAALKAGKLDAIVFEAAAANYYQSQDNSLRVVDIPQIFPVDNYVVAVKKGNSDLLNKINNSIKKMTDQKTIDNFVVKYYN